MIAHVVLFTPRASLSAAERDTLLVDLQRACQAIPEIRRARVGRRRRLGMAYDSAGPVHFEFMAVLEFDSESDLRAYLQHPTHEALGRWFYTGAEVAVAEDFEMAGVDDLRQLLGDAPA